MSITEFGNSGLFYGVPRFFISDRCIQTAEMVNCLGGKIKARELVTFDCGLMEMEEIEESATYEDIRKDQQILAVIIRPEIEPDGSLKRRYHFEFCGYDLVDITTYISAVTNCGGIFDKTIPYDQLNDVGLIKTYRQAVMTQLDLNDTYPNESHSYCEIVELWRKGIRNS